jgi:hypothetical protein
MRNAFNIVMRIVSSLIGLLLALMGCVWMLQGFNLAFRGSFMVGDKHWALYGAILAIVGVCQVVWSNIRQTGPDPPALSDKPLKAPAPISRSASPARRPATRR